MPRPLSIVRPPTAVPVDLATQLILSMLREDFHQIMMSELRAADTVKEIETVTRIRERIETALKGRAA